MILLRKTHKDMIKKKHEKFFLRKIINKKNSNIITKKGTILLKYI
jgi:hypothetical protein